MILIQAQNAVKEFDGVPLFNPISFEVKTGERIALIGLNGAGKSTILKMIMKKLPTDQGQIIISKETTIGYLSQDVITDINHTLYQEALSVFDDVKALIQEIDNICQKISDNPNDEHLLNDLANKQALLDKKGGYNYEYKINTILTMFGFPKESWNRPISTFSGGEKTRIAFAKLLLINPDVLLLDEPTNHLDIVTIEWLEDYLKSYKGAILFVSHDKAFINNLANKILELENKNLSVYYGNYDQYAVEKQHRYEIQLKAYNHQQKEIEKIKRFIAFYMPKPRFVSRAHDREKKLARLEGSAIDKPYEQRNKVHIDFMGEIRQDKELIKFKDVAIGYPDDHKPLIAGINLMIRGQDHIAIMGPNGAGKTTFVKTLMGKLAPLQGHIEFKTKLSIGYLRQDFMNVSEHETIFDYFKNLYPLMEDQKIYDHLGKFSFSYEDDNSKYVDSLSGGEQMRVILAKLCLDNYDILILDEPTNHLDLFTKSELEDALSDYKGTLIVVSHDRDFIDAVADRILYFHDSKCYVHNGSYQDFLENGGLKKIIENEKNGIFETKAKPKEEVKEEVKPVEEKPKKVSEYTVEKLMDKISKKEEELNALEELTDNPDYYQDSQKLDDLEDKIDAKKAEIKDLYNKLNAMSE